MKEFIAYMFYVFIKFIDIAVLIFFQVAFLLTILLSICQLSGEYIVNQKMFIAMFAITSSSLIINGLITNPILKLFTEKTLKNIKRKQNA